MSHDDEKQSGDVGATSGWMFQASQSLQANVLLIGDSTWAHSSSTLAAEPGNVMVCNLSVKGQALQQNERHQEKKLGGVVKHCAAACAALTEHRIVVGVAAGAQFGNAQVFLCIHSPRQACGTADDGHGSPM